MNGVKTYTRNRMEYNIAQNPLLGEDTISDHNNVEFLLKASHILKIFKLILIILNTSYFVGIVFMIISDACRSIAHDLGHTD